MGQKYIESNVKIRYNKSINKRLNHTYEAVMLFVLLIVFILIELKHPFFFLQDDNRSQYMSYYVYNYKSLASGQLPFFNFHQFLGIPALSAGQSAVLYPFSYISVFISKILFGHYFATIDVFVIIHLMIGALGIYNLIRFITKNKLSAFFAGVTWPLTSFVLYVCDSWVVVAGTSAFFPWMVYFCLRMYKNLDYKSLWGLVIVRLCIVYIGHPQFFMQAVVFEVLTIVTLMAITALSDKNHVIYLILRNIKDFKRVFNLIKEKKKSRLARMLYLYFLSYINVLFLSLPLILPLWYQTSNSLDRSSTISWSIFISKMYEINEWFLGLIWPFSTGGEYIQQGKQNVWTDMRGLSFIGYFTLIFVGVCIYKYFVSQKILKKYELGDLNKYILNFLILFIVALLWSSSEMFNSLIYVLPILNRFRWPFKIAFFTSFYLVCLAAIGFSLIIKNFKVNRKPKINFLRNKYIVILLLILQVFSMTAIYMYTPVKCFKILLDTIPYNEPLTQILGEGKIFTVDFDNPEEHYAYSMGFDYATFWGLYHFAGYDPLIPKNISDTTYRLNYDAAYRNKKFDTEYLRRWGVKWYILNNRQLANYSELSFPVYYKDNERTVLIDNNAAPFVFWDSDVSNKGIYYDIGVNSITIDADSNMNRSMTVNFLYNSFFKLTIDGKTERLSQSDIGQMKFEVPKGKHKIIINYSDPYFYLGLKITIAYILGVLVFILTGRLLKNKKILKVNKIEHESDKDSQSGFQEV